MSGVVVTGIGVTAPNGVGTERYWAATLAGTSGIRPITRFDATGYPCALAGEVPGFDAARWVPGRVIPQTDHWTHLSFAATSMALDDAGLDPARYPEFAMGVITSTSSSGGEFGQRELAKLWSAGPRHVGAFQSIAWFYAATTGQLSIRYGMRGPCAAIAAEQAGGLDAIAHARRVLRDGPATMVVSGGTDASLAPYGLVAQLTTGHLATGTDPAAAYTPFDRDAAGYVPGEGGAILVLEDEQHAVRHRRARPYARIAGHAATFDPRPGSGRPGGLGRAVAGALDDAGLAPADIDVVFADAAGVAELDLAEASVLTEVFGPRGVPVTAPKTMTGRLYAGAALDVAAAALAIRDGLIPPTVATRDLADGCDLDLVLDRPREAPVRAALVVARGHGGFNSAMVLVRHDPFDR
ncbi:ketosynthase chain-length factor [Actinokineospora enzanensis]|uniref:ketosynthase chain-length factor n=1 Tax=Actinokineospora enzanensis TaxID=155975 RepID=UPI00036D85D1|nr:ketosynthase chain-length factor [Actinokineospora enzanensis]